MTVYQDKLRRLSDTIGLQGFPEVDRIARALGSGGGRLAFAVGSGGSAIAAEFFARCRATLGHRHTVVQTPMEFVQGLDELGDCDVWLFSAGADNPDVAAALQIAIGKAPAAIHVVTVRSDGASAIRASADPRCEVVVLPVADPKDGFLATHSLVATVAALSLACEPSIDDESLGLRRLELIGDLRTSIGLAEDRDAAWPGFDARDTLIILNDPQVRAVGVLLETSAWETGLCPVQRTDFRNFAHGRHVWLAKRAASTYVLALTTTESRPVWEEIEGFLPPSVRRTTVHLGDGGRDAVAAGLFRALALVGRLGDIAGIDPGRPGVGEFARSIYEGAALTRLSDELTPAARHKRDAVFKRGRPLAAESSVGWLSRERLDGLGATVFKGLVLDYDGTIVETGERFSPPCNAILAELRRLVGAGLEIGVATGRGGSAGEMLRRYIPAAAQSGVLMGYYNGALVRTLAVDLAATPPDQSADVVDAATWLAERRLLRPGRQAKLGRVQLEVNRDDLIDAVAFAHAVRSCPPVAAGRMKVLRSQHSFDFVDRGASKLAVVRAIAGECDAPVLRIGDSGGEQGNDHELLSGPHGISVDAVCGTLGTWSIFGGSPKGPAALLRILTSVRVGPDGARLDVDALIHDP